MFADVRAGHAAEALGAIAVQREVHIGPPGLIMGGLCPGQIAPRDRRDAVQHIPDFIPVFAR